MQQQFPDIEARLVLIGSVRHEQDQAILNGLKSLVEQLQVKHVELLPNASYEVLMDYLKCSSIGLHTMFNEHFGISIIEYMVHLLM